MFVRHGESFGNVANNAARESHALRLDLDVNDIDVGLTDDGQRQAEAVGRWLAEASSDQQPTRVLVSPYARTQQTAQLIVDTAGRDDLPIDVDERLRDREQGVLDRLTNAGVRDAYPEEATRREYVGKFWYRPPGGESWADIALRLRALLLEVRLTLPAERMLVVTHDVPILVSRYILERLAADDVTVLSGRLRNCSVTSYRMGAGGEGMELDMFNDTTALDRDDSAPITARA
jgi:broad specificity phosphatase PhoE